MIEKMTIEKSDQKFIVKGFDNGNHIFKFNSFEDAIDYINKTIGLVDYDIPVYCNEELYNQYK